MRVAGITKPGTWDNEDATGFYLGSGYASPGAFYPFFEFGADLTDFFVRAIGDSDNPDDYTHQDAFVKFGFRATLGKNLLLGISTERISVSYKDKGNPSYQNLIGISLGFIF